MTPLERLEAERYPTRGDTYLARRRGYYTNTHHRAAAFTAALRHNPAEEWWERAACAGVYDPDVFYPASAHPAAATVALDYCRACLVRVDCKGWGTALKPAFEPVVVARKPLSGTVAANVLTHGTGALNIDPCRIVHASPADRAESRPALPLHRTQANYGVSCSTCDDGGCPDCTDPA